LSLQTGASGGAAPLDNAAVCPGGAFVPVAAIRRRLPALPVLALALASPAVPQAPANSPPLPAPAPAAVVTVPGMPPVPDATNLYSETTATKLSPAVDGVLQRVYVPHVQSNDVYVIDPATMKVVDRIKVGINPQHVVPSWDLKTLWVANNAENTPHGSLTPLDPKTGKAGKPIKVDDPYNMYFTPDGQSAIIVAEALKRLDFRDPVTFKLQYTIDVPGCAGINHADFSIDGKYAIFTCEFAGTVVKIDMVSRKVLGYVQVIQPGRPTKVVKGPDGQDTVVCTTWKGMPQDIRASPDGKLYYVADMMADGVHVVDGESFRQVGFIFTGKGTHGLYPSRDGRKLYVANRGSNRIHGPPKGKGGVSVIDFATQKVEANWPIPGGGSPDMGNVSADGKVLWLSGRYDNVVYAIDTTTGDVKAIPVGKEPHGLTVWPQPGRYSLGHTGNLR
jgi:YVTN family beta-propeller protein